MDKFPRRQSILKMDNDSTPTKTFTRNKRISFSGKNSVKEFNQGNDKLTAWGESYEKDMTSLQKSDSTIATEASVSVAERTAIHVPPPQVPVAVENKENVVPIIKDRYSIAFLDNENSDLESAEQTMIHAMSMDCAEDIRLGKELMNLKSFRREPEVSPVLMVQSQGNQQSGAVPKQRQTIHYQEEGMDESMTEELPKQKARPTIYFENGQMEESMKYPPAAQNPRQTIHFPDQQMDESIQQQPRRETIHFNGEDAAIQQSFYAPKNSRQTIHFNQKNSAMDESVVVSQPPPGRRGTVYFNDAAMDESLRREGAQVLLQQQAPKAPLRTTRNTVYYQEENAGLDETTGAGQGKVIPQRQTLYDLAAMDISSTGFEGSFMKTKSTPAPPAIQEEIRRRQTVYYNENEGNLDESVQVQRPLPVQPRRETVFYAADQGRMEESMVLATPQERSYHPTVPPPVPVNTRPPRQTIYYTNPGDGQMDESVRMEEQQKQPTKPRQTIYEHGGMDISLAENPIPVPMTVQRPPITQPPVRRETVYFQEKDANLDLSCVAEKQKPVVQTATAMRRGTVYYVEADQGRMEESMVMATPREQSMVQPVAVAPPKIARQTIYFAPEAGEMDESVKVEIPTRTTRSSGLKQRQTIYEHGAMDISTVEQDSRRVVPVPPQGVAIPLQKQREEVVRRQTVYYQEENAGMDESSVAESRNPLPVEIPETREIRRETIHFNEEGEDAMNESKALPPALRQSFAREEKKDRPPMGPLEFAKARKSMATSINETISNSNPRRGTFNVPAEESRLQLVNKHLLHHVTITEDDMQVSDLNNSEDSIELIDSQGNPRPIGAANLSQRVSLPSPELGNETAHDLQLNFNVTGQIVLSKEEEEEQEREEEEEKSHFVLRNSRIPVAKALRTPRKEVKHDEEEEDQMDVSLSVDVPRRAVVPMGHEMLGEENVPDKEAMIFPGKQQQTETRMSIPLFSEGRITINNHQRQTMLEMNDVTEYEPSIEEDDDYHEEKENVRAVEHSVLLPRTLDVEKFEDLDYEEVNKSIQKLRRRIASLLNATPLEESVYIPPPVEKMTLRDQIMKEIKEEAARRMENCDLGIDWGCFPMALEMEDMIKNLVVNHHKNWRYQDLFYFFPGLLRFRHRLVKTFEVVIQFQKDPEFEEKHYLLFESYDIFEDDLSKWCPVDVAMHKELMKRLPLGLLNLYPTSIELGRFLSDVDRICTSIFKEFAF